MTITLRLSPDWPGKFSSLFASNAMPFGITIAHGKMSLKSWNKYPVMPGYSACNSVGGALKIQRNECCPHQQLYSDNAPMNAKSSKRKGVIM